jgi:hypothetical protein
LVDLSERLRFHRLSNSQHLPAIDKIRLISLQHDSSSAWLTSLPTDPSFFMPNHVFRMAMKVRLGIPAASQKLPSHCPLCKSNNVSDPNHLLGCSNMRQRAMTDRHNHILDVVRRIATSSGVHIYATDREHGRPVRDQKIPDGEVQWLDSREFIDVSVIHPASKAAAMMGNFADGGAAKLRENAKMHKYLAFARSQNAEFRPLVCETYGGLGKEFTKFVHRLADRKFQNDPEPEHEHQRTRFVSHSLKLLSFALLRGNWCVLDEGERKLAAHYSGRHPTDSSSHRRDNLEDYLCRNRKWLRRQVVTVYV